MTGSSITMGEYIDSLDENASPTDSSKLIIKETSEDPKYAQKQNIGGSGGGGAGAPDIELPAGSWDLPASNEAVYYRDSQSNQDTYFHAFPDTGNVYGEAMKYLGDISAYTNFTIIIVGYAATGPTSAANVEFQFGLSSTTDGSDWNVALSTIDTGDLAVDTTAGPPSPAYTNIHSFTDTIANWGFVSNSRNKLNWTRIAPSANNLTGEYRVEHIYGVFS